MGRRLAPDRINSAVRPAPRGTRLQLVIDVGIGEIDVSAPPASAMASRSDTSSITMLRPAPSISAERIANWPTGPQPQIATVSPGSICALSSAI
jgi:hypothetical protein